MAKIPAMEEPSDDDESGIRPVSLGEAVITMLTKQIDGFEWRDYSITVSFRGRLRNRGVEMKRIAITKPAPETPAPANQPTKGEQ